MMGSIANISNEYMKFNYIITTEVKPEFQIHCHDIYEIYYFLEGDVDYLVEGKKYRPSPHSLLLLSPHVFHGVRVNSNKPYSRYTLHFNPNLIHIDRRSLLLSSFPDHKKNSQREIYYEHLSHYKLLSFFEALVECSRQSMQLINQLSPVYLESLLAQLTIMQQSIEPIESSVLISSTITEIINYLNLNLTKKITLDSISNEFFISKHYLNRAFRKATGTTLLDYLNYKRVIYAKQLMMNGYSASQAAAESGFGDYSVFYRAYKKVTAHSPNKDLIN